MTHKTNDLLEATVLCYFGHTLTDIESQDGRGLFTIEENNEEQSIEEVKKGFERRALAVEPKRFNFLFKENKRRLYSSL